MNKLQAFDWIMIPRAVWESDLTWTEKCLIAMLIEAGALKEGCCLSNDTLAAKFKTSRASMANMLSGLRKTGWLVTNSFDGRTRSMSVKI